jgi:hypothetical protein
VCAPCNETCSGSMGCSSGTMLNTTSHTTCHRSSCTIFIDFLCLGINGGRDVTCQLSEAN